MTQQSSTSSRYLNRVTVFLDVLPEIKGDAGGGDADQRSMELIWYITRICKKNQRARFRDKFSGRIKIEIGAVSHIKCDYGSRYAHCLNRG